MNKHYGPPKRPAAEAETLRRTGQHLHEYILSMLNRGTTKTALAQDLNVSRYTLRRWCNEFGIRVKRIATRGRRAGAR